ncbi:MAG: glycerophosphodiester phosphodiesterase family protein [Saprospiraceae bacterium]|nr:glycerophosphodiester phosphodiesterase family protein [Saprospiraceae bacterium]
MKRVLLLSIIAFAAILHAHAQLPDADSSLIAFLRKGPHISAHRGGMNFAAYPENCLETFEHLLSQIPAIIELDVEMTADSVLIILHDNTLHRTTTGAGAVAAHTWEQVKDLKLKNRDGSVTDFSIPLLADALEWAARRGAVFTIDVKRNVPFEKVIQQVERYKMERQSVIITYTAADALQVYTLKPDILISANMRSVEEADRVLGTGIPADRLVAFVGTREPSPELYDKLKALNIPTILGTMGNLDNMALAKGNRVYLEFIARGAVILSTDRPVEAWQAIMEGE